MGAGGSMTTAPTALDPALAAWLAAHADGLDTDPALAAGLLPRLAEARVFSAGVPVARGGAGGSIVDAIVLLAEVAEHSVTAAFVFWGHRTFIEYLLHSPNEALAARLLPDLLAGRLGGATGLSNAMKYLSGIEQLQCEVRPEAGGLRLDGTLPWVTNLRKEGFVVALAAHHAGRGRPAIYAVPDDIPGLVRTPDLDLIGLRASNTAALRLEAIDLPAEWELHPDADRFLPQVRPAFLGLQCGLSLGLARASLRVAGASKDGDGPVLGPEIAALNDALDGHRQALLGGVADGTFAQQPARLFHVRIALAELVNEAVQLELQARGGRAYVCAHTDGFARRLREAAFVPIVTPSLVQLKTQLAAARRAALTAT
jgi:alkylation response protein AidB-like acyl-CoA dehydrogenase